MKENGEISHIITKLNIVKMLLYHISIYKYDVIPIKIPMRFFPIELTKLFLKYIPKNEVLNRAKSCEQEEQRPQLPIANIKLIKLQHQRSGIAAGHKQISGPEYRPPKQTAALMETQYFIWYLVFGTNTCGITFGITNVVGKKGLLSKWH